MSDCSNHTNLDHTDACTSQRYMVATTERIEQRVKKKPWATAHGYYYTRELGKP